MRHHKNAFIIKFYCYFYNNQNSIVELHLWPLLGFSQFCRHFNAFLLDEKILLVAWQTHLLCEAHSGFVDTRRGKIWSTVVAVALFAPALGIVRSVDMWALINFVLSLVRLWEFNLAFPKYHAVIVFELWFCCLVLKLCGLWFVVFLII